MKDFTKAKKIDFKGKKTYYWIEWNKELKKNFVVLYPPTSMNNSSMEPLEKMINETGHPTLLIEPRWTDHFKLDDFSNEFITLMKKEGIENPICLGYCGGYMILVDYVYKTNNADKIIGICGSYNFYKTAKNKFYFYFFDNVLRYGAYIGSLYWDIKHKRSKEKRGYPDQSKLQGKRYFPDVWLSIVDLPFSEISAHIKNGKKIIKWDISEKLGKVDKDMILIYGKNDMLVTPKSGEYIKKQVTGNCIVKVIEGEHSLPITRPKKVMEVLREYLI